MNQDYQGVLFHFWKQLGHRGLGDWCFELGHPQVNPYCLARFVGAKLKLFAKCHQFAKSLQSSVPFYVGRNSTYSGFGGIPKEARSELSRIASSPGVWFLNSGIAMTLRCDVPWRLLQTVLVQRPRTCPGTMLLCHADFIAAFWMNTG